MEHAEEIRQDITHHWAHFLFGFALPITGAGTGWYAWQWGTLAGVLAGPVWEIGGHLFKGWKISVIGMLSFGAGAAVASALLLIAGG
jgi:hypothetical protein